MTKIKFEIEIDAGSTPDAKLLPQLQALTNLVQTVAGQPFQNAEGFNQDLSNWNVSTPVKEEAETPAAEEKPAPKKPRKPRASKKAEPKKEEAETPESTAEETKEESQESDEQRLIAVRALLSKTIQEGGDEARDKCVDKLQEMEAKNPDTGKYNISSLDPSKYDEFTEFLNSL